MKTCLMKFNDKNKSMFEISMFIKWGKIIIINFKNNIQPNKNE